jgi:hypothetical protein
MNSIEEIAYAVFNNEMRDVYTSTPGVVVEYDSELQQAKVKAFVGNEEFIIPGLPVHQIGGDDWLMAIKIIPGTEGMIEFCMRDISKWLYGADDMSSRKFSSNDARFSPGFRSEKNAIKGLENNGIQLRSRDGKHFFWLKDDGDTYVSGNLHVAKKVISEDDVMSKGEVLTRISHTHSYIDSVGQPPVPKLSKTNVAEQ